jgi:endonuclease-3 related protein
LPRKSRRTLTPEAMVRAMYRKLVRSWGPQHWWPAETPFEIIVGAILTQNTSWGNVERALASLLAAEALTVAGIRNVSLVRLQELVYSSGYYRQKAQRLKDFVSFLDEKHNGSLETMLATPCDELRAELLSLRGIGPETADSILLFAGNHEIFVVDAYTRRVLERHRAIDRRASYDQVRNLVQRVLQREKTLVTMKSTAAKNVPVHNPSVMSTTKRSRLSQVYNEMHGLFVQVGKHYCLKQEPRCEACPLGSLLPPGNLPL